MREKTIELEPDEAGRPLEAATSSGAFDDLASLRIFARVVELQSFSEVARRMGVTPATISKHIAALESRLGSRLVNRTTRRLFVTDAGTRLYLHCVKVLDELRLAEAELSELRHEPAGLLKVGAPLIFGARRVAVELPRFLARHPKISVDIDLGVEKVDVYEEHIDVAIRIADEIDPGLVAIRLAPYRRVFCASPGYLATHGTPVVPDDLASHQCLYSRGATVGASWPVRIGDRISSVRVSGRLTANHGEAIRDATVAGMGVSMTARWLVEEHLRDGRLVEVLADYVVQNRSIFAVLSQRGAMTPKVRAFVDFMRECMADLQ